VFYKATKPFYADRSPCCAVSQMKEDGKEHPC